MYAEGLAGFDFNKKNSADDVACVYNFNTRTARDTFSEAFEMLWEEAAGTPLATDDCVGEYWAWALE